MTARKKIAKYITELTSELNIDHAMNLFESGNLSSLDVLDLIVYIETTFNITISDDDIGIENIGSIDNMVKFIEKVV
ncbi:MAG: acyl carrier protein [Desulfobacteraceae bacterium]|nr:acyl carrier protein [Desulfobacteraceae bacterium]MBC2754804.1 acyl carrier protein [Desulfobacteraceae bacterium]